MATKDKKKKPVDWRANFIAQFPNYASIVDGGEGEAAARRELGGDFVDLLLDYANNPDQYDLDSQAGRDAWARKVQATNLYTKVGPSRREWAILPPATKQEQLDNKIVELRKTFGELQLDDSQLTKIATYALSNKASELQTRYYAYSVIPDRQTARDGAPTLEQTDMAGALREALNAYGYSPPNLDKRIQSALTGTEYSGITYTEEGLMKQARDYAKIMYPQFSQQLDQGYSMEDVFEPYREIAASTLDINKFDIKVTDKKFSRALQKNANGESLSPDEWAYMLRRDPQYGWQNTREAKTEAANLISILERTFGTQI